jgi:hypothetical protein
MNAEQRISAFVSLGEEINAVLSQNSAGLNIRQVQLGVLVRELYRSNPWFTEKNVLMALSGIAAMLRIESLRTWLSRYDISKEKGLTVGVVMAGNIPAVGFHDFLCVLISGNSITAKLSSDDRLLLPALAAMLTAIEPQFAGRIHFTEAKMLPFNALIATGSNNSARYFEYYFSKYPRLIRKNRTSVAVIEGTESEDQLKALFDDVFSYFGMGCRNVTHLFLPQNYDIPALCALSSGWTSIKDHSRYYNNYEYHKAGFLINNLPHYDTDFFLLREDHSLFSPISVLHYSFYTSINDVKRRIIEQSDDIQCVVSVISSFEDAVGMGQTQQPGPEIYADGVDTLQFILTQAP